MRDGLAGGLKVVWVTGAGPGPAVAELARRGIAAGPALAAGQMAAAETEGRLLSGQSFSAGQAMAWLDGQMTACRREGFPGLRVAVDMSWALRPVTGAEQLPDFEQAVAAALAGTAVSVLCQYDRARFDPVAVLDTVEAEACTSLYGVPTMFIASLEHPSFEGRDLSSLRTGIMAGSPCPVEVMKQVVSRMHMEEVTICYGMTETSPVSTQSETDDPLEKRVATVGRVHPHVEIKITDPDSGAVVAHGETGELCTRGYCVMLCYWSNEEATRDAIDAGRWMHTGDLATMDAEGYVNIVGRIKDMIIRGGENIYPREIEEFLYTHPDISDVQVIGVPSEKYGEEVMAWVKVREGAQLAGEQLAQYCEGRIARYKVPRYWKFMQGAENWPMTISGKVMKYKMRELAVEELGLQAAAAVRTA